MDGCGRGATPSVTRGRDGVTGLPTPSNSVSAKRSRDEAEDMAVDRLAGHVGKRAKKKATQARKSPPKSAYPLKSLVVSASNSIPKADPLFSQTLLGPPLETTCLDHYDEEPVSSFEASGTTFPYSLQESFSIAQDEIRNLKEILSKQDQRHHQEQLWLKQDLMLDMLQRHEQSNQTIKKLHRDKHHLTQYANEQKAETEKQKKKAEEEEAKHTKVRQELTFHKGEVEHLQNLNKVMEEDLDELRQIENEDATHRQRKSQGLPPAYGSLDDEDQFPPPQLHEDSGSFDVAVFKRTVREDFMTKLNAAQRTCDALRNSPSSVNSIKASNLVFTGTSFALSDSCRTLRTALEHAENAFVTKMDVQIQKVGNGNLDNSQYLHLTKREFARRDFVADRIAKTILDLSWRVISASELRPYTLRLENEERTLLNLAYKEVDECLLEALRQTFLLNKFASRKNSLMWEYQHYFTQISAMRRGFNNLHANLSYLFFSRTLEWLGDQVEIERMNQANRSVEDESLLGVSDWGSGSDISSENAGVVEEGSEEGT